MNNFRNRLMIGAAGISALAIVGVANSPFVDAAAPTPPVSHVRIARYTLASDRIDAVAEVLGTTPSQLRTTLKTSTFKAQLQAKQLTKQQFAQKVQAQLKVDLTAQGYTTAQIAKFTNKHHARSKLNHNHPTKLYKHWKMGN